MLFKDVLALENREYSIGELSSWYDVTLRTIRYYEQVGLIAPEKKNPVQRVFRKADVLRLDFIIRSRSVGLTIKQIQSLVRLMDRGDDAGFQTTLKETLKQRQDEIEYERQTVEKQQADVEDWLTSLSPANTHCLMDQVGTR